MPIANSSLKNIAIGIGQSFCILHFRNAQRTTKLSIPPSDHQGSLLSLLFWDYRTTRPGMPQLFHGLPAVPMRLFIFVSWPSWHSLRVAGTLLSGRNARFQFHSIIVHGARLKLRLYWALGAKTCTSFIYPQLTTSKYIKCFKWLRPFGHWDTNRFTVRASARTQIKGDFFRRRAYILNCWGQLSHCSGTKDSVTGICYILLLNKWCFGCFLDLFDRRLFSENHHHV
jgi:hypothetical protein